MTVDLELYKTQHNNVNVSCEYTPYSLAQTRSVCWMDRVKAAVNT